MKDAISRKRFVVDSSFVLNFLLQDERTAFTDSLFRQVEDGKVELISVNLLPYEVLNGLKSAVLRKRVRLEVATQLAREFLEIPIETAEVDWNKCFQLAFDNGLTIYDAAYLVLAKRYQVKILSFDPHLQPFATKIN